MGMLVPSFSFKLGIGVWMLAMLRKSVFLIGVDVENWSIANRESDNVCGRIRRVYVRTVVVLMKVKSINERYDKVW